MALRERKSAKKEKRVKFKRKKVGKEREKSKIVIIHE